MSDALLISAALFSLIALWGVVVFAIGWKHSPDQPPGSRWRRFWIVVFALCGLALLAIAAFRTAIPRNPAIAEATRLALQSPTVTSTLGGPVRITGLVSGGYRGYGDGRRVSAELRLKGRESSATLHACGIRRHGQWELLYAEVVAGNSFAIPLTNEPRNPCQR